MQNEIGYETIENIQNFEINENFETEEDLKLLEYKKIEDVKQTASHSIVNILVKKDYSFKCYDHTQVGIFKKIKEFLIGEMEYNSQTKSLLSQFFRQNKNLIIKNIFNEEEKYKYKMSNFENFLLTIGIYYKKMTDKKSQIVINSEKKPAFNNFIKSYFDINEEYLENDYPFTLFYNYKNTQELENIIKSYFSMQNEIGYETIENIQNFEINENFETEENLKLLEYKKIELKNNQAENPNENYVKIGEDNQGKNQNVENTKNLSESKTEDENKNKEVEKRFCVIVNSEDFMIKTEKLDKSNIKELNIQIEVPENIVFLQDSTKKERKNAKNIFLEYLPIEKKIKLKKLLEDGEKIFSDYSVNEIL